VSRASKFKWSQQSRANTASSEELSPWSKNPSTTNNRSAG